MSCPVLGGPADGTELPDDRATCIEFPVYANDEYRYVRYDRQRYFVDGREVVVYILHGTNPSDYEHRVRCRAG